MSQSNTFLFNRLKNLIPFRLELLSIEVAPSLKMRYSKNAENRQNLIYSRSKNAREILNRIHGHFWLRNQFYSEVVNFESNLASRVSLMCLWWQIQNISCRFLGANFYHSASHLYQFHSACFTSYFIIQTMSALLLLR